MGSEGRALWLLARGWPVASAELAPPCPFTGCQCLVALVPRLGGVTQGHGPPGDCGPHSRGRGASHGCGPHPANSSPLPRVTMGPSCLAPASPASSGLPAPSGPFDCPHLFAHGVRQASPGPGPSHSLGSTDLHCGFLF